ncbi:MAG TPA: hypothetical protein VI299_26165 [Polyangiales bacterium]
MIVLRTVGVMIFPSMMLVGCLYDHDFWDHGHGGGGSHHPEPCPDECDLTTHFVGAGGACVRKAEQISVGSLYTCAILAGGGLKCWGDNGWRKLGLGDTAGRGDAPGEMGSALPFVDVGTGRTVTDVAADTDLTCALLDDASVKCWGYNGYGAVNGIPNSWTGEMGDALPTAPVPAGSTIVDVGAGSGTGYALRADGSLYRWSPAPLLTTFAAGSGVVTFARGSSYDDVHWCGLRATGEVVCFGFGSAGQLGWAPQAMPPVGGYPPVELGTGRSATAIALGRAHSCALLDDGSVKCWGLNNHGQLGLGDTASRGLASAGMGDALPAVPLGQGAQAIAAGGYHTCALLDDGSVKCWGQNDAGQLGQGDTADRGDAPGEVAALAPIALGEPAVAVAAGLHSCAILASGGIKCWGPNAQGQLGQGDTETRGDAPGEVAATLAIDLSD